MYPVYGSCQIYNSCMRGNEKKNKIWGLVTTKSGYTCKLLAAYLLNERW